MKKTLIIHTGGTISMKESGSGSIVETNKHPLSNDTYHSSFPIEEINLFHIPSPHITPDHMLELTMFLRDKIKTDQYDGVVITHGTDTLEESSYFVDLCIQTDLPIIFLGAMRSSNEIGSDGLYNLLSAIQVARHPSARNRGVLVVMNGEIHDPQYVTKTSSSNIATFQSPQIGPIGIVLKNDVHFFHAPMQKTSHHITSIEKHVVLLKVYAGMTSELLDCLDAAQIDGIVIEAFGQGNVPPAIVPSIKRLKQQGVVVMIVTRCLKDFVQPTYNYEGGGRQLFEDGVIFGNQLSGPKARLKLMILLEKQLSAVEIINEFNK